MKTIREQLLKEVFVTLGGKEDNLIAVKNLEAIVDDVAIQFKDWYETLTFLDKMISTSGNITLKSDSDLFTEFKNNHYGK